MWDTLERLRTRSDDEKSVIALATAGTVTLLIAGLWFIVVSHDGGASESGNAFSDSEATSSWDTLRSSVSNNVEAMQNETRVIRDALEQYRGAEGAREEGGQRAGQDPEPGPETYGGEVITPGTDGGRQGAQAADSPPQHIETPDLPPEPGVIE